MVGIGGRWTSGDTHARMFWYFNMYQNLDGCFTKLSAVTFRSCLRYLRVLIWGWYGDWPRVPYNNFLLNCKHYRDIPVSEQRSDQNIDFQTVNFFDLDWNTQVAWMDKQESGLFQFNEFIYDTQLFFLWKRFLTRLSTIYVSRRDTWEWRRWTLTTP